MTGNQPRAPLVIASMMIPPIKLKPPTADNTVKVSTWFVTGDIIMLDAFPGSTSTFGNEQAVTEATVSMKAERLAYFIRSSS